MGRSISKKEVVDKIQHVSILDETLITVLAITSISMMVKTNTNQDMIYLYWIGRSLDSYSSHLGIGTTLNIVLVIMVDKDRAELRKNFLTNIVFQTIRHLNQELFDMVLVDIV